MRRALAFLAAMASLAAGGVAWAQAPENVALGAIRWDAWFDGAPDQKVLEQPEWRARAPFFARVDESGKLRLDGEMEHVLHAETAYARAIGLDYFVFGFYPDTGSWGREIGFALRLDRALRSYLALPDRMGVRFALSVNQLYPADDIEDIADTLASLLAHPDYMRSQTGTAPLYILAADGLDWSKPFGTDEKAREAIATLRRKAREKAGAELTVIVMHYETEKAIAAARRYGADMVSAYSSFAPGDKPTEQPYAACARHGESLWASARAAQAPYVPNVTLGWDTRPRTAPAVNAKRAEQGPWCARPTAEELRGFFAAAARFATGQGRAPFVSTLIYAWNEFTEGGWMAPNLADGQGWMQTLRAGIGRNRAMPEVKLTWPDAMTPQSCPLRTAERDRRQTASRCRTPVSTPAWPCPPGMNAVRDMVVAPSGYQSLLSPSGWSIRTCAATNNARSQ